MNTTTPTPTPMTGDALFNALHELAQAKENLTQLQAALSELIIAGNAALRNPHPYRVAKWRRLCDAICANLPNMSDKKNAQQPLAPATCSPSAEEWAAIQKELWWAGVYLRIGAYGDVAATARKVARMSKLIHDRKLKAQMANEKVQPPRK